MKVGDGILSARVTARRSSTERELRASAGLKVKELAHAEELARENRDLTLRTSHEHLGR